MQRQSIRQSGTKPSASSVSCHILSHSSYWVILCQLFNWTLWTSYLSSWWKLPMFVFVQPKSPDSNVDLVGKVYDPSILGDWGMRVASSTPLWVTEEDPKAPIQFTEPVSKQQEKLSSELEHLPTMGEIQGSSPAPPSHTKIFLNIQFVRG